MKSLKNIKLAWIQTCMNNNQVYLYSLVRLNFPLKHPVLHTRNVWTKPLTMVDKALYRKPMIEEHEPH
jgi:hypothetical protein